MNGDNTQCLSKVTSCDPGWTETPTCTLDQIHMPVYSGATTSVKDCRNPIEAIEANNHSSGPTGSSGGCSPTLNVTGKYDSQERSANDGQDHAEPINLNQDGAMVSGWYRGTSGQIGTFDGTLSGCTLTGNWHQDNTSGPYQFVFTGSGESLVGGWNYSGGEPKDKFSWTATRVSTTPDAQPYTPGLNGSGCTSNSDCGTCKRCELSTGSCLARLTCR